MKICNVMLSKGKGGLQQMSAIYALAMKNMGHNVISIMQKNSPYIADLQKENIVVKICENLNIFRLWNTYKFIQFMQKNKMDIVVCHGKRAISLMSNSFLRWLIKPKYKIVGVMHSKNCNIKNKCDKLIFLTDIHLQRQPDFIKQKSCVLANTILDIGCDKNNTLHSPLTFGAMGRLHKIKGYDILLNALHILKTHGRKFKFVLAGTGEEEKNLMRQIKKLNLENEVSLTGWVDDKQQFFDMTDVFVLSSRSDVMPLSVLEAFAYSTPVIATRCDGPKEVMSQEFDFLLVPIDDENALAAKMEQMIENKNQLLSLGKKAKKVFVEQYSFLSFTAKLAKILNEVIK